MRRVLVETSSFLQRRRLSIARFAAGLRLIRADSQVNEQPVLFRSQVAVAHRHQDRGVAEPVLDLTKRRARHHERRGERVAAVVPPDAPQPSSSTRTPEALVQLPERQRFPVRVAEDARSLRVSDAAQRGFETRRQRDLALLAALRGSNDAVGRRSAKHEELVVEVQVRPLERELLPGARARVSRASLHSECARVACQLERPVRAPPHLQPVGDAGQNLHFVAAEGVEDAIERGTCLVVVVGNMRSVSGISSRSSMDFSW